MEASSSSPYFGYLVLLAVVVAALVYLIQQAQANASSERVIVTAEFASFQRNYCRAFLCALACEWLQNSHLFVLLRTRGLSTQRIAEIFAAGYVASWACGVLGEVADQLGRRRNCMLCFVLFALSSLSVHSSFFSVLVMGRVMAGVASSLLQTVFDSWMLAEHYNFAYPDEWLAQTYQQVASGTTIVAVGAGLVSEAAAALGGISGPFDVSLVLALSGLALVMLTWTRENFAAPVTIAGFCDALGRSATAIQSSHHVFYLVILQACFEAAIHIALFMWVPVLYTSAAALGGSGALDTVVAAAAGADAGAASAAPPPFGVIFSMFMSSLMLGSYWFQLVAARGTRTVEELGRLACVTASVAMVVLAAVQSRALVLLAFLVFEVCKGVYYPVVGTLRGQYIPMEVRTIISQCSKPVLGAAVLVLLLNFAELSSIIFVLCAVLLSMAAWCQHQLIESKAVPDGSSAAVGGEVVHT